MYAVDQSVLVVELMSQVCSRASVVRTDACVRARSSAFSCFELR
jgi:hypothetical protein